MIFHQLHADRGCCTYLIACEETRVGLVVDPVLELGEQVRALLTQHGITLRYVADTHTHADHFTGARDLARRTGASIVMHAAARQPFVDLAVNHGETLIVGRLRVRVIHTPGHTKDAVSFHVGDRVLTGDALLIGGCGRTDFPGGSPESLHDSLFERLLTLPDDTRVYPGHDYKRLGHSTIGAERQTNPRLARSDKAEFVALMDSLALGEPDHLTEALRTNLSGGKTVEQLLKEAAERVPFVSMSDLAAFVADPKGGPVVLDVRERSAWQKGHVPGAVNIPRGELELRVNQQFRNPTRRIVCVCQFGKISTLAAATLRDLGFGGAAALDGGYAGWVEAGHPTESG